MGSFSFLFFTSFLFTSVGLVYIASLMQNNMSTVIRCVQCTKEKCSGFQTDRSKFSIVQVLHHCTSNKEENKKAFLFHHQFISSGVSAVRRLMPPVVWFVVVKVMILSLIMTLCNQFSRPLLYLYHVLQLLLFFYPHRPYQLNSTYLLYIIPRQNGLVCQNAKSLLIFS